jgi:hypothetical protein
LASTTVASTNSIALVVNKAPPGVVLHLESLLSAGELGILDELWHSYGTRPRKARVNPPSPYVPRAFASKIGSRADAGRNFRKTGGRFGRSGEPHWVLEARTGYFRHEYSHGETVFVDGAERILANTALADAARQLHGLPVVVPYILYGNLLLPGQELGLHTDVPAFRGVDRTVLPLWFLVVMRHSGLFDRWRIPVATAVAFVGECAGGEFAYYPDGPAGEALQIDPASGSVVMLDADTVFHGVDRVVGDDSAIRSVRQGSKTRLVNKGRRHWLLRIDDGHESQDTESNVFSYESRDLRFSASWKAYCFADEDAKLEWLDHSDDLRGELIMDALVTELCERSALTGRDHGLSETELAYLMIDTFIQFPEVTLS